jgi:hypothetical protein
MNKKLKFNLNDQSFSKKKSIYRNFISRTEHPTKPKRSRTRQTMMENPLNYNFTNTTTLNTTTVTTSTTSTTTSSSDTESTDDPDNDTDDTGNLKSQSWTLFQEYPLNWNVEILLKTRLEKATNKIAKELYAPIVYQMSQKVTGPSSDSTKFIMTKFFAISETNEILTKNGKSILIGGTECGLTFNETEKSYQGTTKIQFNANSSHFEGKEFKLLIQYFIGDMNIPIYSMVSSKFRVYARKPNKKKENASTVSSKRKLEQSSSSSDDESPKMKKIAIAPPSQNSSGETITEFKDFTQKLEELLKFNRNLPVEQKQFCMELAIKCFLKVDPKASKSIMMNNLQQLMFESSK